MKIAIPTNDRQTIAERTGRCKEFAIIDMEGAEPSFTYKENTHTHGHHHGEKHGEEHSHSHDEIIAVLDGVDMLIVKMMGKHLKNDLEAHAIPYTQTTETEIVNIIKEYK